MQPFKFYCLNTIKGFQILYGQTSKPICNDITTHRVKELIFKINQNEKAFGQSETNKTFSGTLILMHNFEVRRTRHFKTAKS